MSSKKSMMVVRKMREMKESGVEWIGEIPQSWDTTRFKHLFDIIGGNGFKEEYQGRVQGDFPFCKASDLNGATKTLSSARNYVDQYLVDKERYNVVPCGSILISKIGEALKKNHRKINLIPCVVDNNCEAFSPKKDTYVEYYYYVFCVVDMNWFDNGGTVPNVNNEKLRNSFLPMPSQEVQCKIADYLDAKCAKIDALIAKQQEIIEKLKAYKLSVITEAVTKGLNPNVPMKESGVDFMGSIPSHWEMVRLKFLLSHIIDCPHETPEYSADGEYLVIRTADQDFGFLRPDENMYRLDENEYQNRIRRLPLDKDDIVYGREGERWGLACLVPESNRYCLGQRMMQFRCNPDMILPEYAMWALNSRYVYLQGSVDTIGSTSPHVNISTMRNYNIPTPPLDEQRIIVERITEKTAAIEETIQRRSRLIDRLIEYKKSMIYEVVTGKREV